MMMPGREYQAQPSRFGFNGKENDNEVKGFGNQQDYGMRIYDTRIGRFLSVDPLEKDFVELSPYQFASNSPIEGIDLEGLEYLSSSESRIEVIMGNVRLKVENMTWIVRNRLNAHNSNMLNWAPNSIGANLKITEINLNDPFPEWLQSPPEPKDADPNNRPDQMEVGKPTAKSTDLPDRRFSDKIVTTARPGAAKGLAIATVAIEGLHYGLNLYVKDRIEHDKERINHHINLLRLAGSDVNYALAWTNFIPPEFQTEERLSDILNVVLFGDSHINKYDKEVGAKILEIGKNIYNNLSVKRKEYTGRWILSTDANGKPSRTLERNPSYDPKYIKENPPLEEKKNK